MEGKRFSSPLSNQDGLFVFDPLNIKQDKFVGTTEHYPVTNGGNFPVNKVEFQLFENWGNEEFTCVYRIRIHGKAV